MKWALAIIAIVVAGCMAKVTVDKRPNIALPIYSNSSTNPVDYVMVDQGYKVRYMKFGLNTEIQSMAVDINTNKTVSFQMGGFHSNVSTNGFVLKMEDLLKISQLFREGSTNDVIVIDKGTIDGLK